MVSRARVQNILDNSTIDIDERDSIKLITCVVPNGTAFLYVGSTATEEHNLMAMAGEYFRKVITQCENYLDNDKVHYGYDETGGDCLAED